ncbi:MAG: HepT-like ribonuclease domain-containing protein, partial [Planctomycetota bacterium]
SGYREALLAMGDRGVLPQELAARLAAAAGLRNLIAHRYGVLDWQRIHVIATTQLDDLLHFCDAIEHASPS